ncbi:hypothetical protein OGM23_10815 [Dickeya fangzhongdai]|uniref:hypothetical protein n=1 Tax=Dickeya fangzhongdai TaxID=1778540 RepID=UPI002B2FA198|nr:hypothetical protein OGM23_10815 [Dickeya fangzhongdai]
MTGGDRQKKAPQRGAFFTNLSGNGRKNAVMPPTGSCGSALTKTAASDMFPPGKLSGIIRAEEVNSSRKTLSFRGEQSVAVDCFTVRRNASFGSLFYYRWLAARCRQEYKESKRCFSLFI